MLRRRPPIPAPRSVPWTLKPLSTAETSLSYDALERMVMRIRHDIIKGVTPEMLAWWFANIGGEMEIDGRIQNRYLIWHPFDHIHWELVKPAASGRIEAGAVFRIVEAFGIDTFRVIDTESQRLEEVAGIGKARRLRIKDSWKRQRSVRDIMIFLHAHGLSTARALRLLLAGTTEIPHQRPLARQVTEAMRQASRYTRVATTQGPPDPLVPLYLDQARWALEVAAARPRDIVREPMMHRTGRSYHLPTGSAIYFDTGVIELATPVIEISKGCAARAGRSLWEAILYLRRELDVWERRTRRSARLKGFSAHYNISFELSPSEQSNGRSVDRLAYLLSYILPVPVMLLAANRESTGVGVRPRGNRIEVTVDFTPSPSLMIATGTFVTGVVRSVMEWETFELNELASHGIPRIQDFRPMPHTSRKGWLARFDCFPANPFESDVHQDRWPIVGGATEAQEGQTMTLRQIGGATFHAFRRPIRQLSDPFTFRLISLIMNGQTSTLLDLDRRPDAYDDVGRLVLWDDLFPERVLRRSMYERVLIRAISGRKLRMNGETYTPVGLRGWSEVVFRRDRDGRRRRVSFDSLLIYIERWERAQ